MSMVEMDTGIVEGRRLSKLMTMFDHMVIEGGKVYFETRYLYGALFTTGKDKALLIIQAEASVEASVITPYLRNDGKYLQYEGLVLLLMKLSQERPKKAPSYLAANSLIAAELEKNYELKQFFVRAAYEKQKSVEKVVQKAHKEATKCALSGLSFSKGEKLICEIHHIEGQSEKPGEADDPENLIPLLPGIHEDYHNWVRVNERPTNRASLKQYAAAHGYRLDW